MPYYQKPTTGERLLMFGDGDEAIFDSIASSSTEGYFYVKLRPTPQMRWRKQIPDSHFNENDRWIHKIYRKDLCFQLSFDPDFPVWLILCDYNGKEDTIMIESFIKCKNLITRNRQLETDLRIATAEVNSLKKKMRKKAEHPSEDEMEKLAYMDRVNKVRSAPYIPQGQQPQQLP